jgi:hypothetical protein
MEPTNLNPSSPDDPQLDAWLRAHATAAPLPDDGFSQRVLANLPPGEDRAAAKRRILFCLVGAGVGALVPWFADTGPSQPATSPVDFGRTAIQALQPLADPHVVLAAAITGVCLLYVFPPRRLIRRHG